MEALGIPSVLVATDAFEGIIDEFAPTVGMDGYPSVFVPHPVSTLDDEALNKLATAVIDLTLQRLTA